MAGSVVKFREEGLTASRQAITPEVEVCFFTHCHWRLYQVPLAIAARRLNDLSTSDGAVADSDGLLLSRRSVDSLQGPKIALLSQVGQSPPLKPLREMRLSTTQRWPTSCYDHSVLYKQARDGEVVRWWLLAAFLSILRTKGIHRVPMSLWRPTQWTALIFSASTCKSDITGQVEKRLGFLFPKSFLLVRKECAMIVTCFGRRPEYVIWECFSLASSERDDHGLQCHSSQPLLRKITERSLRIRIHVCNEAMPMSTLSEAAVRTDERFAPSCRLFQRSRQRNRKATCYSGPGACDSIQVRKN